MIESQAFKMEKYYYSLIATLILLTCSSCEIYKDNTNHGTNGVGESGKAPPKLSHTDKPEQPTWDQWRAMFYDTAGLLSEEYGNNYKEAINDFSKGLELDHDHAYLYVDRGYAYDHLKQYKNAVEDFSQAIKVNSKDAWGYRGRASVYEELGQREKAIEDFSQAIKLDPKDSYAYANRAWTYAVLGKFKNASEDALEALQLEPTMAEAYDTLGYAQAGMGVYDKALDSYNTAIKLDPTDGEQYYHRAELYEKLHNRGLANNDHEKAKRLGYVPKLCKQKYAQ